MEARLTALVSIVVLVTVCYTLAIFMASRRKQPDRMPPPDDLFIVFLVPCLNEELVIGGTLDRLLEMDSPNFAVMVIDDGSDDGTAEIVRSYDPERVWLFQRTLPEARQGKGEALNAAYRYLREIAGRDGDNVLVAILDADGRLAPNAIYDVASYFRDTKVGAVQIGVRMYNAGDNLLTRMQDFEFVAFTEIFQRGRQRVGSVGLGGNGQFTRLSALMSLGDAPWTDCLTEDLDLGVRLRLEGWTNAFCSTTHVAQQAVKTFRLLVRQRSRWFQGHLQCWSLIPVVLRSRKLKGKTVSDLVYHLSSPALVLLFTAPVLITFLSLLDATLASPKGVWGSLTANGGLFLFIWYIMSFGMAPFFGFVYWLRDEKTGFVKSIALAHVYNLYSYFWFIAGWRAVFRVITGKRGWAKTARTPDTPVSSPAEASSI